MALSILISSHPILNNLFWAEIEFGVIAESRAVEVHMLAVLSDRFTEVSALAALQGWAVGMRAEGCWALYPPFLLYSFLFSFSFFVASLKWHWMQEP